MHYDNSSILVWTVWLVC